MSHSFDFVEIPLPLLIPSSNMAPRPKTKDHRRKKGPVERNGRVRKTSWRKTSLAVSNLNHGTSPSLTSTRIRRRVLFMNQMTHWKRYSCLQPATHLCC
jgi:hypothetical protein